MEFYRQTSQYTGAASSFLMAMHQLKPESFPLDREQEFRLWMRTANLPTRSSSIYGLALVAKEEGVPVKLVVGEKEYDYPDYRFKRYRKVEVDEAKYSSKLYAKRARANNIRIEEREFELAEVRELLKEGKLIILRVNAGIFRERSATSKYVVVEGFEKGQYIVMDPEQGEMRVDDNVMQEAFDTLVTKKKRDHRMIVLG